MIPAAAIASATSPSIFYRTDINALNADASTQDLPKIDGCFGAADQADDADLRTHGAERRDCRQRCRTTCLKHVGYARLPVSSRTRLSHSGVVL